MGPIAAYHPYCHTIIDGSQSRSAVGIPRLSLWHRLQVIPIKFPTLISIPVDPPTTLEFPQATRSVFPA